MEHDSTDFLISVEKKYVSRMLRGEKKIELRRRALRVSPGSRVWIYTKAPDAIVGASGTVHRVITGHPSRLWRAHRQEIGVSRSEFQQYFVGATVACALVLENIQPIDPGVHLKELRLRKRGFQPPQFFARLRAGSPLLQLLNSRLRTV